MRMEKKNLYKNHFRKKTTDSNQSSALQLLQVNTSLRVLSVKPHHIYFNGFQHTLTNTAKTNRFFKFTATITQMFMIM